MRLIAGNKGTKEYLVSVWRKVRRGRYLYLIGVVGCLVTVFGLREGGLELGSAGLLLIIMLYMTKDVFDKR